MRQIHSLFIGWSAVRLIIMCLKTNNRSWSTSSSFQINLLTSLACVIKKNLTAARLFVFWNCNLKVWTPSLKSYRQINSKLLIIWDWGSSEATMSRLRNIWATSWLTLPNRCKSPKKSFKEQRLATRRQQRPTNSSCSTFNNSEKKTGEWLTKWKSKSRRNSMN